MLIRLDAATAIPPDDTLIKVFTAFADEKGGCVMRDHAARVLEIR